MTNNDPWSEHAESLDEARQKLEKEFHEVRESLGDLRVAIDAVNQATAEDNLHDLLKTLEKEAKSARDGGMIGSGANDHRRALKKYIELRDNPPAQ